VTNIPEIIDVSEFALGEAKAGMVPHSQPIVK